MPEDFVHELRVRYGECDPQGIVFNANYLLYFDVAFTEMWREAVGPWQDMVRRGFDAVVAHAEIDFRAPARFDDALRLPVRVLRLGRTAVSTEVDVMREDELLVAMRLRHVCVTLPSDSEPISTLPWPEDIRAGLSRFLAEGSPAAHS
jgi:acyl-CoA thioester hydrolase